jgi:hypothetical protein
MEAKMNPNNIEPIETVTPAGMSDAAGLAATESPERGGRLRGRLLSGWRFTRHLLEMVAGMAVLGAAIWVLGKPPGYSILFVEYGLMGAFMSVPMVACMRHRGHAWSDGGEMTAAMLFPMSALVVPVELGVVGLAGHSLMMLSHVALIGGMVALMVYRFDRYAHGAHDRRE